MYLLHPWSAHLFTPFVLSCSFSCRMVIRFINWMVDTVKERPRFPWEMRGKSKRSWKTALDLDRHGWTQRSAKSLCEKWKACQIYSLSQFCINHRGIFSPAYLSFNIVWWMECDRFCCFCIGIQTLYQNRVKIITALHFFVNYKALIKPFC